MTSTGSQISKGATLLAAALLCLCGPSHAVELAFPGTPVQVASSAARGQHLIAVGPHRDGALPTRIADGFVQDFTWQITADDTSTSTLQSAVAAQLADQGYEITFTCTAQTCGGFDFRHALPLGNPPEMYVDLSDFTYTTAQREGDAGLEEIALMISRGGSIGFVHLAMIQPVAAVQAPVVQSSRAPEDAPTTPPVATGELIAQLITMGSAALDDLQFETGASQLSADSYASLTALAAYLNEDSTRRIMLVGHTDALGSLSGNIALSEARARAVRRYLTATLNVSPAQVEAQGIGYLSPRAPNTTTDGREANRRVEVVLVASD